MPYPTAASPRRRLSALVSHAPQQRPSTPQGTGWGDVNRWAGAVVEKIRVASATGRIRFLPWYDPYTEETEEIRAEYRKMLTESSVKAAFQTKILSVISLDVQVQAADDDDPRQQQAAQFLTYAFRKIRGGMRRVGWSVLHPAVIDGHSVCEKVWKPEVEASGLWRGKRIFQAVKAKDTHIVQLGIDPFRNVTGVRGTAFNNAGKIWSPADFIVFSYLELFENPAGLSDFRAAYRPYWIKNTTWQLRSLHLDKWTGPYLKGTYATQDQKQALEDALQAARASTWLTVPMGTLVESVDLSMKGTADFDQAIKDCDREILIAIVGAHLQILEGQTTGGRGNTKVHKETAELIQWFLAASLADVYREQLATPLIEENFSGVEVPDVSVGAVTEEAMLDSLKVDTGLQALGWKLSRRDTGKRYARPWPEPDDVLEAPKPPDKGDAPKGGSPDGASPFSETSRAATFDFCQEGENAGMPGPCPEGDKGKTVATAAGSSREQRKQALAKAVAHVQATTATVAAHAKQTSNLDDALAATYYDHPAVAAVSDALAAVGKDTNKVMVLDRGVLKPSLMPPTQKLLSHRQDDFRRLEKAATRALAVYQTGSPLGGEFPAEIEADRGKVQAVLRQALVSARRGLVHLDSIKEANRQIKSLKAGAAAPAAPKGGSPDGASPFSETVDFCQEGENAGKPGVCPKEKEKTAASPHAAATAAMRAAHPATGVNVLTPVPRDPLVREAHALNRQTVASVRSNIATSIDRLIHETPAPVPLPSADAPRNQQIAAAKKAIAQVGALRSDLHFVGYGFPGHQAAVTAVHPGGPAALAQAQQTGVHALRAALARAGEHVAGLPDDQKKNAQRELDHAQLSEQETADFCQEGENKGKPGVCPKGDRDKTALKTPRPERANQSAG